MSQDYYEILQVHPKADHDAIQAAYERLRTRYDPARLDGAADELVALARQKLHAIESAYAVLTDPQRRAVYDRTRDAPGATDADAPLDGPQEATPDYRPLPPAGRAERPRGFTHEPHTRPARPVSPATASAIAVTVSMISLTVIVSLLITNWSAITRPPQAAQPTAQATVSPLDQYEIPISEARRATELTPDDPQAWILLGNYLYDSAQIVRENLPSDPLYQQRLPRWLEASQAYDQALKLQPENTTVLADKGASLCFYGAGINDQKYVQQGIGVVQQAAGARPDDPLIQLNLGNCLVSAAPPRADEAIAAWERVLQISPVDSPIAQRARELINEYRK